MNPEPLHAGPSASRRLLTSALAMTLPLASCRGGEDPSFPPERNEGVKIHIQIGGKTLSATMRDHATARDFISLLPLGLTLEDYARTEKTSGLPRKLTRDGAPAGSDPAVGDIAYYAPWGNLAIYYRDSGYADGLIILGKIDGGVEALTAAGPGKVTIRLAAP